MQDAAARHHSAAQRDADHEELDRLTRIQKNQRALVKYENALHEFNERIGSQERNLPPPPLDDRRAHPHPFIQSASQSHINLNDSTSNDNTIQTRHNRRSSVGTTDRHDPASMRDPHLLTQLSQNKLSFEYPTMPDQVANNASESDLKRRHSPSPQRHGIHPYKNEQNVRVASPLRQKPAYNQRENFVHAALVKSGSPERESSALRH